MQSFDKMKNIIKDEFNNKINMKNIKFVLIQVFKIRKK